MWNLSIMVAKSSTGISARRIAPAAGCFIEYDLPDELSAEHQRAIEEARAIQQDFADRFCQTEDPKFRKAS